MQLLKRLDRNTCYRPSVSRFAKDREFLDVLTTRAAIDYNSA